MIEFEEIKKLLNKEVICKWGEGTHKGIITLIDEKSSNFHFEYYDDPKYNAGSALAFNLLNVVKIEGNTIYLNC